MNVIIHPSSLEGSITIPPSKSLSHRAIIAASLADGKSVISNVMFSKDIIATIEACKAIGAEIEVLESSLIIKGSKVKRVSNEINANESGSTLRFMIPIALANFSEITFSGNNNLVNRPLDPYFEIFDKIGIKYEHEENKYLPLKLNGMLTSGTYSVKGNISSQFITGLLFSLPLLEGTSKIIITTKLESVGYVDLTIDILKKFGIEIINNNYEEFIILGKQTYKPFDYEIEGDYSQAAFFLAAGAMGANLKLNGMNPNSYQGDKKILNDLKAFGCDIYSGSTLSCLPSATIGATIDFSQSPDLGPILTVLASVSKGTSRFINAGRLRIKECDRITCMKEELNKMGANISEEKDGMTIQGVNRLKGAIVDSHNDHRVAMALAMASLKTTGDIKILNAECVSKSFPNFWEVFKQIKGCIDYE